MLQEKKLFSLGYPIMIPEEQFKEIILKYEPYIDSVFLSPPIILPGKRNYTTMVFADSFWQHDPKKAYLKTLNTIDFLKSHGIKIDVAVNDPHLLYEDYVTLNYFLDDVHPEELTVLKESQMYFEPIRDKYFTVRSFNSYRPKKEEYEEGFFDSFVLTSQYFWNKQLRPHNGVETRFITDSGCPTACIGCANDQARQCGTFFKRECKDISDYLAYHILLGKDIRLFEENFLDENFKYKIGSRLEDDAKALDIYLQSLIEEWDIATILSKISNGLLYYRYSTISEELFFSLNPKRFDTKKESLWTQSLQSTPNNTCER